VKEVGSSGLNMSSSDVVKRESKTPQNKPASFWNTRFLTHIQLLGQRLYLFSLLRFAVAAGIALSAQFARHVVGIEGLRVAELNWCAGLLALYNLAVLLSVRPYRDPELVERAAPRLISIAHATIVIDYLFLTMAIWLVGGARSPFLAFYLLHAILASMLLSRQAAVAHAAFGYLLLSAIVVGEWLQWIPSNRPAGAVFSGPDSDVRPMLTVLLVYGLLMVSATYLMTGIATALRAGERRLRAASEKLDEIAALRRAFLHVVLHDLRGPVSTVITLLETLASGELGSLEAKPKEWVERGENQLRGIIALLHDLQILSDLEIGGIEDLMAPVNLLTVLPEVVDDHQESAQQHGLELRAELPATLPSVRGVDRLLREAIANYLTNAIKYTPSGGRVMVRASYGGKKVRVEVVDSGFGIGSVDQARLFHEFVRLTKAGEKRSSRPPGSGLGLSIVRRIAEAHGGSAGVSSTLGQGSTFFIELPVVGAG
jgi:signal transduction histidine kinase